LLIPKSVFSEVWYFDPHLKTTQDYDMWIKFIKHWYTFVNLPEYLTQYRVHADQDSIKKKDLFHSEIKNAQKYILENFTINEVKEKSWLKINKYVIYIFLKYIFLKQNILWSITIITQKIWLYKILAPLYRKIFIK
jgi:hypothetical protein